MRALLDGDLYSFRSAASAENDDLGIAIYRCEEMIDNTLAETSADEFSIFLSGDTNFRYSVYPAYKSHRVAPKPRHLKDVKQHLIDKYKAEVSVGCEADDLLGIAQCSSKDTIICSLDKDLLMIPGKHYSFEIGGVSSAGKRWVRPANTCTVDEFSGLVHFYTQILVGDSADFIKGASGIGKVKAERILAGCATEQQLFEAVSDHMADEEMAMTAQVLWIWRKPNDSIIERWKGLGFIETSQQ